MVTLTTLEAETMEHAREPSLVMAWYGLAAVALASAFAQVDQRILILVTEPIKRSLGLSDTQIGLLNGIALSLVAAIATYPMGMLADRIDRRRLLAACVLLWSASTAVCGLIQTFPQLFVGGMGIALGEAVLGPICYSMIADLFPRRHWMLANYIFYIAGVAGGACGLMLSGATLAAIDAHKAALPIALASLETWRLALMALGAPGILIALMIVGIRRAPSRTIRTTQERAPILAFIRRHIQTLFGVFLGFGFAAGANVNLITWVPVALVRQFHEAPGQVGLRLGGVTLVASLLGVLISGLVARRMRASFGERILPRIAQWSVAIALLLMPGYVLARSAWQIYLLSFFVGTAMVAAISLSPTLLQRIAPNKFRSRVIALGGLSYVMLLSLTPVIVGRLSDTVFHGQSGLLAAMIGVSIPCGLASLALLSLAQSKLAGTLQEVDEADTIA